MPARGLSIAAPRAASIGAFLGLGGLAVSALFMVYLNVVANGQMSVLDTTMSDYVFVADIGWMFAASLLSMCLAGVGVAIGLSTAGLLRGLPRFALGLAVLGLLLAAVFRTDLGESLSLSAQIHRYAAGVVFFCVPIAALLVARRLDRGLRCRKWLSANVIVTSFVLALFLTSHLGAMPEVIQELNGLFQRTLFVFELALLAQLMVLVQRPVPDALDADGAEHQAARHDDREIHPQWNRVHGGHQQVAHALAHVGQWVERAEQLEPAKVA